MVEQTTVCMEGLPRCITVYELYASTTGKVQYSQLAWNSALTLMFALAVWKCGCGCGSPPSFLALFIYQMTQVQTLLVKIFILNFKLWLLYNIILLLLFYLKINYLLYSLFQTTISKNVNFFSFWCRTRKDLSCLQEAFH